MNNTLNIETREYRFEKANASKCWGAIKSALEIVGDINFSINGKDDSQAMGLNIFKGVLANLGNPALKELENLILSHTTFVEGKGYRLSDNFNEHFNEYPQDLFKVLIEGAKFQLLPFFPNGEKLLKSMNG